MANKHKKKMHSNIIHQRNLNKTTIKYHFTPIRMVTLKNKKIASAGENVGKLEPSYNAGGDIK